MEYIPLSPALREQANAFIRAHWFSTEMIIRGKRIDMTAAEGFLAMENGSILGLITFIEDGDTVEILSLDSVSPGKGIGTRLIGMLIAYARENGYRALRLITTNDNLAAMGFYQRRGFDMAAVYRNALDLSRKMKPSIPLIGENNIPLRHEIEFEYRLFP